jgi:hypothetical protein
MEEVKVNIKKPPVKKPVARKTEAPAPEKKKPSDSGGGIWKFIGALVFTAIIVGIAVYGWQKQAADTTVNQISQESRTVRQQFEDQIETLKDTLSSMQNENETLKKAKEELDAASQLLGKATLDYTNTELGLSFEYPAALGEVKVAISEGAKGKYFKGEFSKESALVFGGISEDFANATATVNSFLDTRGYLKRGSKYYFLFTAGTPDTAYELKPFKTVKAGDSEVLLLNKAGFPAAATGTPALDPGEGKLGALANLGKDAFPGVGFWDQDVAKLSQADFEKILSSITILQ